MWDPQKWVRRNFYECRNFEKMLKTGLKHHKPHHNKFAANNSTSFWKKSKKCEKKSKSRFCLKIAFFMQVLFLLLLLLFLLLKCCLSKSPYSDLHFDYPSFSHISYSLRVILDWKFFFEKKSTVSHLCPEFSYHKSGTFGGVVGTRLYAVFNEFHEDPWCKKRDWKHENSFLSMDK